MNLGNHLKFVKKCILWCVLLMHACWLFNTIILHIIHLQVWEMFLSNPLLTFLWFINSSSTKATWDFVIKWAILKYDWTQNGTTFRHSFFKVASHFQNRYSGEIEIHHYKYNANNTNDIMSTKRHEAKSQSWRLWI